jgi:hypothetical protein
MTPLTTTRSRVLPVPYFVQPTGITCQSTCLKMFAAYLEQQVVFQSTGAAAKDIQDIWKEINTGSARPAQVRNSHANLRWWLEKHFPSVSFEYVILKDAARVSELIVEYINGGMPVLMSVSHARVPGHIVLVVGYENYAPNQTSVDFKLVVHDPYGSFDPLLLSKLYGANRWTGGASLLGGGQSGPGSSTRVPVSTVGRKRAGDQQLGTYYLLSGRR